MTTEEQTVTQKVIGFSFHVSVEKEIRIETGAKYPDKTIVKASLGGHADTYTDAIGQLKTATETVKTQLDELQKK